MTWSYHILLTFLLLCIVAQTLSRATGGNDDSNQEPTKKPCQKKSEEEELRRRTLQQNMLDVFGVNFRPNPQLFGHLGRNTVSAKKYMYNLYKSQVTADCMEMTTNVSSEVMHDADTVVSFVNTNALTPRPNTSDERGAMYFDVQSNLVGEKTLASELRIYLDVTKKTVADSHLKIFVYEIIIPKQSYTLLNSLQINATASAWHGIDVMTATKRWKETPSTNNGVLVVCKTLQNRMKAIGDCGLVDFKEDNENKPFLVSFYQSGDEEEILAEQIPQNEETMTTQSTIPTVGGRKRRGLKDIFPQVGEWMYTDHKNRPIKTRNRNLTCSKRHLYITFKDLGWSDWIMAPEGYSASYCGGECKFATHDNVNASNHALIQTLVNMMLPETIPPPCCAPVNLEPLQVLFLDERNNVIMKKYANMVVNDCACQ